MKWKSVADGWMKNVFIPLIKIMNKRRNSTCWDQLTLFQNDTVTRRSGSWKVEKSGCNRKFNSLVHRFGDCWWHHCWPGGCFPKCLFSLGSWDLWKYHLYIKPFCRDCSNSEKFRNLIWNCKLRFFFLDLTCEINNLNDCNINTKVYFYKNEKHTKCFTII